VSQCLRIAYLGPEGTFCEQAARKYFQDDRCFIACPAIRDVFDAVEQGKVVYGTVPVENSLEGSERRTLDLLFERKLMISGEIDLRVIHNLIVRPGTELRNVQVILSHPQALAQCRRFLEKCFSEVELREVSSTARAVQQLPEVKNAAAIGTEIAAEKYGMEIAIRQIEDDPNNFTRFFILGREDGAITGRDKTSLIFSAKHEPGALYRVLEVFAARGINLTKIESRPQRGTPWEYVFYLDFEGHRAEQRSSEALEAMREKCIFIKVLGSYPRSNNTFA
jgi:chorismate mutase/prephenate dehydratase